MKPLSWIELVQKIMSTLSVQELNHPCAVWPPDACPHADAVNITGLDRTTGGLPVITTGKQPT